MLRAILVINSISILPNLILCLVDIKSDKPHVQRSSPTHSSKLMRFLYRNFFLKLGSFTKLNKLILVVVSIMCLLMQSSSFFINFLVEHITHWSLPLALLLISFGILPNYMGNTCQSTSQLLASFRSIKKRIQKSRHKIGLFTSLWKAGLTLLVCQLFNPEFKFKTSYFWSTSSQDPSVLFYFTPFLVQLAASLTFYMACSLAFKLRMSRLSFALPLTLTTPVTVAIVLILSKCITPGTTNWFEPFHVTLVYSNDLSILKIPIVCGIVLWWLSHLWAARNIWNNVANSRETTIKR